MGDGADMALEYAEDTWYSATDNFLSKEEKYDRGLCDERGYEYYPGSFIMTRSLKNSIRSKPYGPGKCPICGDNTHLVTGKYGKFYGCDSFPECKGNRNFE